jgi:hypothetical protein
MAITVVTNTDGKAAPTSMEKGEANPEVKGTQSASEDHESSDETIEASDASYEDSDESQDQEPRESASDDDETEDESQDQEPKKKNGFKKRIDKLRKRESEARKELEYWKQQALKGNQAPQKSEEPKPKEVVQAKDETGRPDANSFETHEEYLDALTDWKLEQREKALEAKKREDSAKSEHQKQVESFQSKVKDFAKSKADFDDVISDVDDVPLSVAVHDLIIQSENGPELMYELAKNREEFERINKLSPLTAAREIGKLEARLTKEASQEKVETKITKAPKPLATVGSKSSGIKKSIYDPDLSQAEYERLRSAQLKAR